MRHRAFRPVSSGGAQGNNGSYGPAVSSDGRYTAFASFASNLVANDTNGTDDVFVHEHAAGLTTRVSVTSAGIQGNARSWLTAISADGCFTAFYSLASNLVPSDGNGTWDVFVNERAGCSALLLQDGFETNSTP